MRVWHTSLYLRFPSLFNVNLIFPLITWCLLKHNFVSRLLLTSLHFLHWWTIVPLGTTFSLDYFQPHLYVVLLNHCTVFSLPCNFSSNFDYVYYSKKISTYLLFALSFEKRLFTISVSSFEKIFFNSFFP